MPLPELLRNDRTGGFYSEEDGVRLELIPIAPRRRDFWRVALGRWQPRIEPYALGIGQSLNPKRDTWWGRRQQRRRHREHDREVANLAGTPDE